MDDDAFGSFLRTKVVHGMSAGRATAREGFSTPREHCMAADCQKTTSGGKPYCADHLDQMPYVARLNGNGTQP